MKEAWEGLGLAEHICDIGWGNEVILLYFKGGGGTLRNS